MDAGAGNWTLDGDDNAKLPELLKAAAVLAAGIRPRIMYLDAIYSLVIGFVGAILFVLVDKYEPDGPLARLLKFLVLFVRRDVHSYVLTIPDIENSRLFRRVPKESFLGGPFLNLIEFIIDTGELHMRRAIAYLLT